MSYDRDVAAGREKRCPRYSGPPKVNPNPAVPEWVRAEVTQDCILCLSSPSYGQASRDFKDININCKICKVSGWNPGCGNQLLFPSMDIPSTFPCYSW